MNVNDKGIIYYGTDIKYIEELDKVGLMKPRKRDEQFISVSISGYESVIEIGHPDLVEMGRVYADEMGICTIKDNKFHFKDGYCNTLTYIQGYGPNTSEFLNSFYGLVKNERTQNTITVILTKEADKLLVRPEKNRKFEYLSLALHGFIECIKPEVIAGWIIPENRYNEVIQMMGRGRIRKLKVWKDTEFKPTKYDMNKVKYGLFPNNIDMYKKNIATNSYYYRTRYEHLKSILQEVSNINWNMEIDEVEEVLNAWLKKHRSEIKWDNQKLKYKYI
ncbi:hypothetical protein [Vallitalea sp.]|jgi:hypothetical protein|uniref:hypothetical protein n=1 Tax=Vallitalea sp. TaxID=1882829 RepID=UPI0025F5DA09|nr:hypothetical protein [Vallitalea sp.]MCT4687008.1 hypothetical protein [Vallitalea sp.]